MKKGNDLEVMLLMIVVELNRLGMEGETIREAKIFFLFNIVDIITKIKSYNLINLIIILDYD